MDRNIKSISCVCARRVSLSARRAWIEMELIPLTDAGPKVSLSARRAWIEIVLWRRFDFFGWLSLSARRAWIEMTRPSDSDVDSAVALRKESVDRNDFPAG